jgi:hypothetical protein
MSTKKELPKTYKRLLEEELERAITSLRGSLTDSEEYSKMLTTVERLHDMLDEETKPSNSVSRETLATIGANLLGIFMIIKHESVNVITSKALSFVIRPR